ncbi:hypothetical protein Acr_26g0000370 [Actinidia rufa]|uniref:HAT dimerization domain-containing protein n=1 Tax=Actinidia rufa TaxID=165716 RepID=A0A7J0H0W9_9ERIC|nr:hypothetical protein Acr_26g0000370 [Actinidia rufa]
MPSSQSLRPSAALGAKFDDKPLWNHVKVVAIADGGGGNRTWKCNYGNKKVVGSYTKVKGHLLRLAHHNVEGCMAINYISIPEGSDLLQQKKRKGMASGKDALVLSFNVAERDVADKEAARMFYASGLPFNFARSPYFRKYSLTLSNSRLAGYVPPSFYRLRTTLLAQEKEHINRLLQPIKDTWKKKGVSVVFDGCHHASGNVKDAEYVASLFIQVIKDLGEANVVQIVTDNASNYKAAGLSIEGKYPHIFWTPCVVHSLNLALKSICEPGEKSLQYAQWEDMALGRSSFFDAIHQILECRWNKSNTPLHCMAHSLVPKYYCDAWLNDGGGNGVTWVAPHEDHEVSINRKPISWWANHGASTPLLQALAFKLLSQLASSSCAERNWSTYSMIQSIKRNRLTTSRSEDLVFVHCNLRLLSRKSKEYTDGPTKFWDISGDQFDIEG